LFLSTATVTSAQQLSFTVSADTVYPDAQISIINTSSNIPTGCHFRYSFINGTIRLDQYFSVDLSEYHIDSDTFGFSISPFDSTYNQKNFSIRLELMDSLYQIIQGDSFQVDMLMFSTLAPLPPRACHDPAPVNNQQWCNWNLICNGDFEWYSQCPSNSDQLYLAEDWDGLSVEYYHTCGQIGFTPTTSIYGAQAPRSGDGMGGFYGRLGYGNDHENGSSEAVNVIFKEPLYQQQEYNLEFFVARGTGAPWPNPRYAAKIDALLIYSTTQYTNTPIFSFPGLWNVWSGNQTIVNPIQKLIFSNGPANSGTMPYWEQHSIDFTPSTSSYAFLTIGLMSLGGLLDLMPSQPINPGGFGRYYIDDASLIAHPPSVVPMDGYLSECNGPSTLQVTGSQNVKEYRWYDPNMQLIQGANGPVINITNAVLGTYTVEVENYHHCVNTYTCELLPSPTYIAQNYDHWHPEPVINGSPELCPVPDLQSYSIENPQSGAIYTWTTVPPGFAITPLTLMRDKVTIDWSSATFTGYNSIEITVNAVYPNCTFTKSVYYVHKCCFDYYDSDSYYNLTLTAGNVNILNNSTKLHGIVTIDGNVNVHGRTLQMGPGAKIVLTDNSQLLLDNSMLQYQCDVLWNGIFVQNPSQRVEVINNSTIKHAIQGILSTEGGAVFISGSQIRECLVGIKVIDYRRASFTDPAPPLLGLQIHGSQFVGDWISAEPFTGSAARTSIAGIYIKNVETIEIGSMMSAANVIEHSVFGIYGINIQAIIEKTQFSNIDHHPNSTRLPNAAIYSIFHPRFYSRTDPFQGDVIARYNQFNDCHVGILSMKNQVYLHNNFFQDMGDEYCINVFDCRNPSRINQNVFSTGVKRGIYAARAAGAYSPGFEVVENNMLAAESSMRFGIRLLNIKGHPLVPGSQPRISENQVKFYHAIPPSPIHFGIYADNCHNSHLACNYIDRNANWSDWSKMWGIRLSQSMGAQVYDNDIRKMGAAIYTSGDLYNTLFYCNVFLHDYYGYYFGPQTGLTNQGFAPGTSSTYPNGWNPRDEWQLVGSNYVPGSYRMETNTNATNIISPPIQWYHYTTPDIFDPEVHASPNLPPINGKIYSNPQPNASNVCASACVPLFTLAMLDTLEFTNEERDALYYGILQAREYDELMEEYRMYDEEYLYTLLATDTTLLWLGGEHDQEYRDFYDSVKASNANRFYNIEKLIDSQVYSQALDELLELEPLNTIEANLKTAYYIYLNSWALGRFELTQQEVGALAEIALQLPYAGGRGVYTARIMLGIEPFENELAYRTSASIVGKKTLFAYPNPASNLVTFQYSTVPENETAIIEVHTLTGKLVRSIQVKFQSTEVTINLGNLVDGIYLARIRYLSGEHANVKIVICQ
jgi:hypothetical protein